FLEPKALYRHAKEDVETGYFEVELGKARTVLEGDAATVVSWGAMVATCEAAAKKAAEKGLKVELIDLRSLLPWDSEAVLASVRKTGRLVCVQEAPRTLGFSSEIAATVAEKAIESLRAPVARVSGFDTPFPYTLEHIYKPDAQRVLNAIEYVARFD